MQADSNTACSPENAHSGTASPIAAAAKRERVPEPLGDYLPLPISQKIPPRGTHKLQPLDVQDSQGRHRHHGGTARGEALFKCVIPARGPLHAPVTVLDPKKADQRKQTTPWAGLSVDGLFITKFSVSTPARKI